MIIPKLELTAAIVALLIDQVTEEENELPLLLFGNAKKKKKKWDMVIPDLCHQQGFCNGIFFDVIRLWVNIHDVYIQSSFI